MSGGRLLLLVAASVGSLFGAYTYYYSDNLTFINPSAWTQNGTLSAGAGGLSATDSNGGSLISNVAVPDGTSDYEVKTTLRLAPALFVNYGAFVTYLHASPDAMSGPNARGTAYAFEVQNVAFPSLGSCSAGLAAYKIVNGSVTALFSAQTACHDQMTIRAVVIGRLNELLLYVDNNLVWGTADASILSGKPGVGVRGVSGNSIAQVQLGPLDRIAPTPIPQNAVGVASYSNHIDLQWPATTDDPNGTGILTYQILRNGAFMGWVAGTSYSDTTVLFSTTYTYSIMPVDYHFNTSTTTVTASTPPAGNSQTRQVGLRPSGTYWGGQGENIDMQGGNLNFSIPLLRAKGRGSWSVPVNLVYNSQNWRKDAGGTWKTGYDVGYGFGWKLMAGSLIPTSFGTPHYIFTDATGAEYNLDQQNGSLWTSSEGIYVTYDSNSYRLYFNDGSFWTMGCTSAGTEEDAGTLYPTTMQDSNGNQVRSGITRELGWDGATRARGFRRSRTCGLCRSNYFLQRTL